MTIFVEGGGDKRLLQAPVRQAFTRLFKKAGLKRLPKIVACGGRHEAIQEFKNARGSRMAALLLVDSETAVSSGHSASQHLRMRKEWAGPRGDDERIHLMVQVMESWLLSQPDCVAGHFGNGFNRSRLPKENDLEKISKSHVFDALDKATRQCKKGRYAARKRQGFEILEHLEIEPIIQRSQFAARFFECLRARCI